MSKVLVRHAYTKNMPVKAINSGMCSKTMLDVLVIIKKLGVMLPQYIIYIKNANQVRSYRVEVD